MKNLFRFYSLFFLLLTALFACAYAKSGTYSNALIDKNRDNLIEQCDCCQYSDIKPYIENHNEFWGSNSQMSYWGQETLKSLYKRYEKLYSNIITIYAKDTDFIKAIRADKKAFEDYRNTQKKLVYPHTEESYGAMQDFSDWSSDYTLTVQHIEGLKRKIHSYCLNNSALFEDENICKEERVNELFDSIKLKEPKPVISTPYDKKP